MFINVIIIRPCINKVSIHKVSADIVQSKDILLSTDVSEDLSSPPAVM